MSSKCDGCGSEIKHDSNFNYLAWYGKEYKICRGRGYGSFKEDCRQKFFLSRSKCPSCDRDSRYGQVCGQCMELLKLTRSSGAQRLKVLPSTSVPGGYDMCTQLARSITPGCVVSYDWKSEDILDLIEKGPQDGYGRSGMHAVLVTEAQEKSLGAFLRGLKEFVERTRVRCRAEGRSLLLGLSSGELSTSQYDDKVAQQERGKEY